MSPKVMVSCKSPALNFNLVIPCMKFESVRNSRYLIGICVQMVCGLHCDSKLIAHQLGTVDGHGASTSAMIDLEI